jgi:uncharacterized FAD-dependent dehydrogenase
MLRITELKLPLGHPPEALREALIARLGIAPADLLDFELARRANDARRKSAILMVYSVDVELRDEAAVLARFAGDHACPRHARYRLSNSSRKAPAGWSTARARS